MKTLKACRVRRIAGADYCDTHSAHLNSIAHQQGVGAPGTERIPNASRYPEWLEEQPCNLSDFDGGCYTHKTSKNCRGSQWYENPVSGEIIFGKAAHGVTGDKVIASGNLTIKKMAANDPGTIYQSVVIDVTAGGWNRAKGEPGDHIRVSMCQACSALVLPGFETTHAQWHDSRKVYDDRVAALAQGQATLAASLIKVEDLIGDNSLDDEEFEGEFDDPNE